jgi:hypothetical protein
MSGSRLLAGPVQVLAAALVLVCGATLDRASADRFHPARDGWQTYVNDRYGTRIDFPAEIFTPEPPPDNGDGRRFTSPEARLEVYSFHDTEGETPASMRRRLIGAEGYTDVTYHPSGAGWLVLSGYRGSTIFYEKYFFRGGVISGFGIEFPRAAKPTYAPIIERMENSFRAGRSD